MCHRDAKSAVQSLAMALPSRLPRNTEQLLAKKGMLPIYLCEFPTSYSKSNSG